MITKEKYLYSLSNQMHLHPEKKKAVENFMLSIYHSTFNMGLSKTD